MKHRLSSWKRDSRKKKLTKIKKIIKSVLFFILIALFLSLLVIFFVVKRNSFWNSKSHLNIAINSSPLLVLSIEPPEDFYLIALDEDLYTEVGDLGYYRFSKVFELGELKGEGAEFLKRTIQKELKIPIDIVMNLDNSEIDFSLEDEIALKSFFKNILKESIFKGREGDLKTWDFINLYFSGLTDKLSLVSFKAYKNKSLPDGQEVKVIDETRLSSFKKIFLDEEIVDEGLSIAVWNSTKEAGLGKQVAEILTNMGIRVVDVSSTDLQIENGKCTLRGEQDTYKSHTFQRIKLIFGCDSEEGFDEEVRADMVLIISGEWP